MLAGQRSLCFRSLLEGETNGEPGYFGVTIELPGGDVVNSPARRTHHAPTPAELTSRRPAKQDYEPIRAVVAIESVQRTVFVDRSGKLPCCRFFEVPAG
jgi:hypothetical protein